MRVRGLSRSAAGLPISAAADEMLLDGPGQIRALISCAGNPVTAWPDQKRTIAGLRSLDLLVQIDPWFSQTAQLADFVIAPKMPLEVASTSVGRDFMNRGAPAYGSPVPWGQYMPPVADPPPGSELVEEWEFFYGVAQRMDLQLTLTSVVGAPISHALDMETKPSTDDILEIVSRNSRIPLSKIKEYPRGAVFDEPSMYVQDGDPDCELRLDVAHRDMMRDLAAVANGKGGQSLESQQQAAEFPMRLISRRTMSAQNSCHLHPEDAGPLGPNPVYLHPADMAELGVSQGEPVRITSQTGSAEGLAAGDPNLLRGLISISVGFGDAADDDDVKRAGTSVNRLLRVDVGFDRYSGQPLMSNVPVRVTASGPSANDLGEPHER